MGETLVSFVCVPVTSLGLRSWLEFYVGLMVSFEFCVLYRTVVLFWCDFGFSGFRFPGFLGCCFMFLVCDFLGFQFGFDR